MLDYKEIQKLVPAEMALDFYGIHPVRGKNIYKCFFHNDHKPSAHIDKRNGNFYCFVCNKAFDAIDITAFFENCSKRKALDILDHNFKLGLHRELTKQELKEKRKREAIRLRERQNIQKWIEFKLKVCNLLIKKVKFWESIEATTHPTKKEVRLSEWEFEDLYFTSLKEQERLLTLYDIVNDLPHEYNYWDWVYGDNKRQLFKKLNRGEIEI